MMLSNRIATFVAPAAGGTAVQLRETYVWPQVLPDGKHILHVQYDPRMRRNRLKISEYGGALSADLLETDSRVIYVSSSDSEVSDQLLYVRGGTLLAHPFDAKQLRLTGDAVPIAGACISSSRPGRQTSRFRTPVLWSISPTSQALT
jgi:hypothetical protein